MSLDSSRNVAAGPLSHEDSVTLLATSLDTETAASQKTQLLRPDTGANTRARETEDTVNVPHVRPGLRGKRTNKDNKTALRIKFTENKMGKEFVRYDSVCVY